jgi:hypothetical protein
MDISIDEQLYEKLYCPMTIFFRFYENENNNDKRSIKAIFHISNARLDFLMRRDDSLIRCTLCT